MEKNLRMYIYVYMCVCVYIYIYKTESFCYTPEILGINCISIKNKFKKETVLVEDQGFFPVLIKKKRNQKTQK